MKKTPKILLIGQSLESLGEISETLIQSGNFEIEIETNSKGAVQKLRTQQRNLLIFDLEVFNEEKVDFAKTLRAHGHNVPIMISSQIISKRAVELLRKVPQAVAIEKPFETKEFFGILHKLLSGDEIAQQVYKRFYTNQKITVSLFGNNKHYESSMLNLSKGGAYLEVANPDRDLKGIIKMDIKLDDLQKSYKVNAKVVWNSKDTIWGLGEGFGVEFIQSKDIYRNLLSKI